MRVTCLLCLFLVWEGCAPKRVAVPDSLKETSMSSEVPLLRDVADLAEHDGQIVQLEGVYRRKMEQLSMPRPGRPAPAPVFRGFVVIELAGGDPDLPPEVQLGQSERPDDEVARLTDQRVRVQGRLLLDPDSLLSEEQREMARPDADPVLLDPGTVNALP